MNKQINTFIESKRLKLSQSKCYQIHIEKGHENSPKIKVHDADIKKVKSEKFLLDVIDTSGQLLIAENLKAKELYLKYFQLSMKFH